VRTVKTATALNGFSPKGPYTTSFSYDSFGRLLSMTYPDGEVLTYGYDAGGQLSSLSGTLRSVRYDYLLHQGYDELGDTVRTVYGNGVETRRAYDPKSRFLGGIRTTLAAGREIQDLRYGRDLVGSLQTIDNDVPLPRPSEMGGPTHQSFRHDDLYQLVAAQGSYRSPPNKETTYDLELAYDETGNLVHKSQTHLRVQKKGKGIVQKKTSYDWSYAYGGPRPHAATHIGERTYSYDLNGNQTGWDDDRSGRRRTVTWDEENRIAAVADNGRTTRFLYDAAGVRTNKAGPHGETIYVNPYFSVRNGAIGSKQVWADGARIATEIAQPSLNGSPAGPGPAENKRYFYHPDQLGSAHFVTDSDGDVYQHLEYFPSGETWVAERSESQRTPYLFSGKELDEETGLAYFGARYYEPRQGQWLSADPSFDGMLDAERLARPDPGIGPFHLDGLLYGYVANDPVDYTDPDGLARGKKENAKAKGPAPKRKTSTPRANSSAPSDAPAPAVKRSRRGNPLYNKLAGDKDERDASFAPAEVTSADRKATYRFYGTTKGTAPPEGNVLDVSAKGELRTEQIQEISEDKIATVLKEQAQRLDGVAAVCCAAGRERSAFRVFARLYVNHQMSKTDSLVAVAQALEQVQGTKAAKRSIDFLSQESIWWNTLPENFE